MEAVVEWMDLEYEADFSIPLFDLPARSTEILRSFHESISPSYPIRSADMQIFHGERLSEIRIRIALFGGNGLIDMTADSLSIKFSHMRIEDQAAICRECISLSEQAMGRVFTDLTVNVVTLNPTLFLRLSGGSVNARSHLAQVAGSGISIDLTGFGGAICHPCVNLEIENDDEDWNADFHAYGEWGTGPSMSASCRVMYTEDGAIQGLEDRLLHVERLMASLFNGIGLEVDNPLLGMAKEGER